VKKTWGGENVDRARLEKVATRKTFWESARQKNEETLRARCVVGRDGSWGPGPEKGGKQQRRRGHSTAMMCGEGGSCVASFFRVVAKENEMSDPVLI